MTRTISAIALAALALFVAAPRMSAQDLQQKLAAAKESAARNQQALRSYSWLEKTELSLKGEVKNEKVDMCRYGQGAEDPRRGAAPAREEARIEGQDRREEGR
jgi:hypothetical protein